MEWETDDYQIYVAKSTDTAGTTWATAKLAGTSGIVLSTTAGVYWPAIDIDRANGVLHLIFHSESGSNLYYTQCTDLANWNDGNYWYRIDGSTNGYDTIATDADKQTTTARMGAALALDSSGDPHVLYISTTSDYPKYLYASSSSPWGTVTLVATTSTITKGYPAIEVDSNDTVHMFWSQWNGGLYTNVYRRENMPPYTGLDAGPTATVGTTGRDLINTSVAADDGGNVQVVCENDTHSEIWGASLNGSTSTWTEKERIDTLGWDAPSVGAKLGTNVADDVILAAANGTDPDAVSRWTWDGWDWPGSETSSGEATSNLVSVEKRAPAGQTDMGYLVFDAATSTLGFARITGLTAGSSGGGGGGGGTVYDQTYDFESDGNGWIYDADGTLGLGTGARWNRIQGATGSNPTGPDTGEGGSGYYVYTETSGSTGGDIYTMTLETALDASTLAYSCSFYLSLDLNTSTPDVLFQAWNGSTWVTVDTFPNTDLKPWEQSSYDLSSYTNNDFKVRFSHTVGGTTYLNDLGVDTVRIWGDSRVPPVPDLTLGEHVSGQIADQFVNQTTLTDQDLFRFQLDNTSGDDIVVDQVRARLTDVSGIVAGELTNLTAQRRDRGRRHRRDRLRQRHDRGRDLQRQLHRHRGHDEGPHPRRRRGEPRHR